jgi:hypothetical protein
MFVRVKTKCPYRYLQIVENHREGKRTVQRVLATSETAFSSLPISLGSGDSNISHAPVFGEQATCCNAFTKILSDPAPPA